MDRLLTTSEVIRSPTIIIGGGSHAGRLAEALRSTHLEDVDLFMSGWRLSEERAVDNYVKYIRTCLNVNPSVLMGLLSTPRATAERMAELWGTDPVHASKEGYENIAKNVLDEMMSENVVFSRKPSSSGPAAATDSVSYEENNQNRECLKASTPTIALRRDNWTDGSGHPGGWRGRGTNIRGRGRQ